MIHPDMLRALEIIAARGFTPWEDSCHLTCTICGADGADQDEDEPFPHERHCAWRQLPGLVNFLRSLP